MLARFSALILLAGICWAEEAQPKVRPRLPPSIAGEEVDRESRPALESGSTPGFRSFDDYLQTKSRRPVGLEAFREIPVARAEAGGAEDKGPGSKDTNPASRTDPDILVLPKLEITAERLTKLEAKLAAVAAQQSWWTRSAEAWETRSETGAVLDAILNPPFLKLGGYSASGRAAIARKRVELLNWVRVLSISIEEAKTPAEKARIQADIEGIKEIMKYWP